MYLILAIAFFLTLFMCLLTLVGLMFKSRFWRRFAKGYAIWIILYGLFVFFGTGPIGERSYTPSPSSPFKLPWDKGISRFVSQGNRSFTSHRDQHLFAWDFWMSIGTRVLAARAGTVVAVEQRLDGIGFNSNYIKIEHEDGTRALYAHIQKNGSTVKVGDHVVQGQLIAYSSMAGQTINPHLHFVVLDKAEAISLPITFSDVPEGAPLAGRFYKFGNSNHETLETER